MSRQGVEEAWELEIEHDCFNERDGYVVSIQAWQTDSDGKHETLITPTPAQARDIGRALYGYADQADRAEARAKQLRRELEYE